MDGVPALHRPKKPSNISSRHDCIVTSSHVLMFDAIEPAGLSEAAHWHEPDQPARSDDVR
jgi:hypothetical protein